MTEHAVVIAGAGPTGLMLAGELALAQIDVAIVERRASPDLPGSRAGGLHARTIEVFDQRGIAERFLAEGKKAQVAGFAGTKFDISDFPTRHPYGLGLWQNHIERILAGWVDELAVPIYRPREVTGIAQHDTGVDVELSADDVVIRAEQHEELALAQDGPRAVALDLTLDDGDPRALFHLMIPERLSRVDPDHHRARSVACVEHDRIARSVGRVERRQLPGLHGFHLPERR